MIFLAGWACQIAIKINSNTATLWTWQFIFLIPYPSICIIAKTLDVDFIIKDGDGRLTEAVVSWKALGDKV